jgi:predicted Holliday junction resolvase-like endonuclease
MGKLVSKLRYVWGWCKVNWKFMIGFIIPVIICIILRNKNEKEILKKGLEFREKNLEIERKSASLSTRLREEAAQDLEDEKSEITLSHENKISEIKRNHLHLVEDIDTAEEATQAIKDKLGE